MDGRCIGAGGVLDGDPVAHGRKLGHAGGLVAEAAGDLGGALAALGIDDVPAAMLRGHAGRGEPVRGIWLELLCSARAPPERTHLELQPETPLSRRG